jgi:hypothetical protein
MGRTLDSKKATACGDGEPAGCSTPAAFAPSACRSGLAAHIVDAVSIAAADANSPRALILQCI